MPFFIAEHCLDVLDKSCTEECPVDCIYEGDRKMYINPRECIDCGACEPVCPVTAITSDLRISDAARVWRDDNAAFFADSAAGPHHPARASPAALLRSAASAATPRSPPHYRPHECVRDIESARDMARLILLRHGESEWNQQNRFAGWSDIDLTERGVAQAVRAGGLLRERGLRPGTVHTSVLRRTIETAALVLLEVGREQIPGHAHLAPQRSSLRGTARARSSGGTSRRYGDERFAEIRRSFTAAPPPFVGVQPEASDVRYAELAGRIPRSESLRDLTARLLPYWHTMIAADLRSHDTVLVVGHGNSLRALIKHLDGLSDDAVVSVTVPTAVPLLYVLDDRTLAPTGPAIYLDQDAADAGIAEVVAQGEGVRIR